MSVSIFTTSAHYFHDGTLHMMLDITCETPTCSVNQNFQLMACSLGVQTLLLEASLSTAPLHIVLGILHSMFTSGNKLVDHQDELLKIKFQGTPTCSWVCDYVYKQKRHALFLDTCTEQRCSKMH